MDALVKGIQTQFGGLAGAMAQVAGSIADAAANGAASFAELGAAALAATSKIAQALIIQFALKVALRAVERGGIFGAIAAIALGGLAVAGLNALVGSIKPPKLARGGLAYGPTSAIVGDNPGARFDPEVIAPLSKLRSIIGGSAGASGTIRIEGVIRGRDIYLTNEREAQNAKRTKG